MIGLEANFLVPVLFRRIAKPPFCIPSQLAAIRQPAKGIVMAQTTGNFEKEFEGKPSFTDSPPVQITRHFRAPLVRVWEACTTVEMIKQWWGPESYTAPEVKIDFHEGGKYNFAMQGPDQKLSWSGGEIKEIIPMEKLVFTDHFTDKEGNPVPASQYGMSGDWPEDLYVTMEFEKIGEGETSLRLLHEGIPAEQHDDCVQGWNSSLNKLQKLVERS
jgi:uncharacterized protein YndB with AHSA1/START domain